jgi:hypothetical protein
MIIQLNKFGTTLLSRQAGKEAALVCQALLKDIKRNEKIEVDFEGVLTFSPSWGDEFLTPLLIEFKDNLILRNTANPSVQVTIDILQSIVGKKFNLGKEAKK